MEREIEVKLLGIDNEILEKKLISLGAELIGKEIQENININSSIHPIDPKLGYLRIRTTKYLDNNEEKIYFTFKEQINNVGVRENIEHTTIITSKEELIKVLTLLGYDIYDIGNKKRVSYLYKKCRFDFDIWDEDTFPIRYIEVEAPNKEKLYEILKELKISKQAISTLSIAELKNTLKKL